MARRELHSATVRRPPIAGLDVIELVSGRTFPRHAHDQIGFGVLVAGAQRSWSGRGPVEAEAGDVITSNPGEVHDGAPIGGPHREWRMVYLSSELAAQQLGAAPELARPVIKDRQLRRAVLGFIDSVKAHPGSDPLAVEEGLAAVLALLAARHAANAPPPRTADGGIGRALARLHEAPTEAVSLRDLAQLEGLSVFQLLRSFVRQTGITPHGYQTQLRVRIARRLLAEGRAPAQVACEAGFADQSHLNRVFLRQVGVTPGRYRAATS